MRRSSIFWGLLLIVAGTVFMLDNLGLLGNLSAWGVLWPLVLIAIGAWIIWQTQHRPAPASATIEKLDLPLEGMTQAAIQIKHGAGLLTVNSKAAPGMLISGSFEGGVEYNLDRQAQMPELQLKTPELIDLFIPGIVAPDQRIWSVGLTREIPLNLTLKMGANDTHLDFHDLRIPDLHIDTGASSTDLILPALGITHVHVSCGAASFTLHIPEGVEARIKVDSGISSVRVNQARFPQQDRYYQSLNYDNAEQRADIEIEAGVGSIEII